MQKSPAFEPRDRFRPKCERPDPGLPRPTPDEQEHRASLCRWLLHHLALQRASIRLGVTLATERDELRRPTRRRLPFCPGDEHSGGADGQVSSAVSVSQGSRACKQKRSCADVVGETAACGARQRHGPGDQAACSQCREPAPSNRPGYCSPIGGGVELVACVAAASERLRPPAESERPLPDCRRPGSQITGCCFGRPETVSRSLVWPERSWSDSSIFVNAEVRLHARRRVWF